MSSPSALSQPAKRSAAHRAGAAVAALRRDRAAGIALTAAAAAALVWANWPDAPRSYPDTWGAVAPWSSSVGLNLSYQGWVNQALLIAFFAVVGLEIRREFTAGEMRSVRRAAVPVVAALAGMTLPALLYLAVLAGGRGSAAWGVPMATDVAFALGALALIGPRTARSRVFLMTLAVADDIGSIVVLVVVYSRNTHVAWLAAGVGLLGALALLWRTRLRGAGPVRVALAGGVWWCLLRGGVDAAVMGVALGAFGPRRRGSGAVAAQDTPHVRYWLTRIEAPVNALVLPLFALANTGIRVRGSTFADGTALRIFLAVVVARVAGKPVGIAAGVALARRLWPDVSVPRVAPRSVFGVGAVASIGFTVPLLIINQALAGQSAVAATAGLLVGSVLGVSLGALLLRRSRLRAGAAQPLSVRDRTTWTKEKATADAPSRRDAQ